MSLKYKLPGDTYPPLPTKPCLFESGIYNQQDDSTLLHKPQNVLIVDDDRIYAKTLKRRLQKIANNHVIATGNADTALSVLPNISPGSTIILDLQMPDIDGISLADMINDQRRKMGHLLILHSAAIEINQSDLTALNISPNLIETLIRQKIIDAFIPKQNSYPKLEEFILSRYNKKAS